MINAFRENYLQYAGARVEAAYYKKHIVQSLLDQIQETHLQQSELFIGQYWHSLRTQAPLEIEQWLSYFPLLGEQLLGLKEMPFICSELIGVLHRTSLLLLHSELNKHRPLRRRKRAAARLLGRAVDSREQLLEEASQELQEQQQWLEQWLLVFYQMELETTTFDANFSEEWSIQASAFSRGVQEQLLAVAKQTNFLEAWIAALQEQNKGGFSEKVGHIAAQLNGFCRQLLAAQIGIWQLYYVRKLGLKPLFEAPQLAFALPPLPNGKNIPIHQLENCQEDELVETGGFVQSIEAYRTGDKSLVSRARLYDPSSKKSVWVTISFIHLRHIGIEEGAYMQVHGYVKKQSVLAKQELAIHIDELSLKSLSQSSWTMALLHSAKAYYQAWYGGMNAYWSISKHQQQGKEVTKMGAGELIRQPLYRDEAYQAYVNEKY